MSSSFSIPLYTYVTVCSCSFCFLLSFLIIDSEIEEISESFTIEEWDAFEIWTGIDLQLR